MNTTRVIYSAVLALLLGACQSAGDTVIPSPGMHKIAVEAILPEVGVTVKSHEVVVGTDLIYAYPFQVEPEFAGVAIAPDSVVEGRYSYYLPQAAADLVFTNVLDGDDFQVVTGADNHYLEVEMQDSLAGSAADLVVGTLAATEMTGAELYQVPLTRVVAELTVKLTMVRKNGTPVPDIARYLSRASLKASSFYSKYTVGNDFAGNYAGERSYLWSGEEVTTDTMAVYPLCGGSYIFPSVVGTFPVLTLSLETPDGQVQVLTKQMSHGLEANKHYMLTLQVRQQNAEFEFVFDDFTEEEIPVGDFEEIPANK